MAALVAEATRPDGLRIEITTRHQAPTNADIATREPGGMTWIVRVIPRQSGVYYATTHGTEPEARAYANDMWRTHP